MHAQYRIIVAKVDCPQGIPEQYKPSFYVVADTETVALEVADALSHAYPTATVTVERHSTTITQVERPRHVVTVGGRVVWRGSGTTLATGIFYNYRYQALHDTGNDAYGKAVKWFKDEQLHMQTRGGDYEDN